MNRFEIVKNDQELIDIYNKITVNEDKNKNWCHHDLTHITNVTNMVERIMKELNYNEEIIEEAKIASMLHDTGCLEGKEKHALKSYIFAKEYIKRKNIKLKYEDQVMEAIKNHSDGFDTENPIALVLILSDKLDIKYNRVSEEGFKIKGNRQFQYIRDITVKIKDNKFIVKFICDDKLDKKELEEFYFTPKVFKAIRAFCRKYNFEPEVLYNDEKWEMFYKI